MDNITIKHILYAHPTLLVLLTILFNACLKHGYVPDALGDGLVIPLVKGGNVDGSRTENYRGITISPILSKLLEMYILDKISNFLSTNDLQFGFKKRSGCRDAILTARMAVKFLVDRGSTVTICALDISKAFDKVDYYGLFLKLIYCLFVQRQSTVDN